MRLLTTRNLKFHTKLIYYKNIWKRYINICNIKRFRQTIYLIIKTFNDNIIKNISIQVLGTDSERIQSALLKINDIFQTLGLITSYLYKKKENELKYKDNLNSDIDNESQKDNYYKFFLENKQRKVFEENKVIIDKNAYDLLLKK